MRITAPEFVTTIVIRTITVIRVPAINGPRVSLCQLPRPSFVPVVATVAADEEGNFLNAARWQGKGALGEIWVMTIDVNRYQPL